MEPVLQDLPLVQLVKYYKLQVLVQTQFGQVQLEYLGQQKLLVSMLWPVLLTLQTQQILLSQ
jgi:hypothetical protein